MEFTVARRAPPCALVEALDAFAVVNGMEFAQRFGCSELEVEDDAQTLLAKLNGRTQDLSRVESVAGRPPTVLSDLLALDGCCFG
ncbi:uncharacterized protein G2W53_036230 [Senna tora]|uniref:RNase H type-1 domain-containing protein n=1 Tax=Senna tora TaxID=362788 RepID=A0A834STJ0_9FABA|nr:uncharacterized protein G2W53_036230 [Senna tora]